MERWNVLATSLEGRRDALVVALRRLGRFRGGGYRNVVVGQVADRTAFLDAVRDALATDLLLPTALAKVVPVDVVLRFDPVEPLDDLVAAAEPLIDAATGGTFFVRVDRRGLKGRLHSPSLERELGERVWQRLAAAGRAPQVDFRDPDFALVVETLGDHAGLGVVPRALRAAYPFVRVK